MADALTAELHSLKIPFFVLDRGLVQDSIDPGSESTTSTRQDNSVGPGSSKLTKDEVADLQRRMLELLENLCKSD